MRITVVEMRPTCALRTRLPARATRSVYFRFSRKSSKVLTAALLFAASCFPIFAQPPRGTFINQAPQDLDVWLSFIHFHADMAARISSYQQASPARYQSLLTAGANLQGIAPATFLKVALVTGSTAAQFKAVEARHTLLIAQQVPAGQPVPALLFQQMQTERQMAMAAGISALRQSLTPAEFTQVLAYVNGGFKKTVQKVPVPLAVVKK